MWAILYTDRFPHARINQAGFRMRRYVTAVRRWDTYSIRDGAGLVELRSSPGTFIRPRPEELELICGFQRGDTLSPMVAALPLWAQSVLRWGVLGNCIDATMLTYLLSRLPVFPAADI